jgi:hypothetical protein
MLSKEAWHTYCCDQHTKRYWYGEILTRWSAEECTTQHESNTDAANLKVLVHNQFYILIFMSPQIAKFLEYFLESVNWRVHNSLLQEIAKRIIYTADN